MIKPITAKPATSINNHTGSWRLNRPAVDFNKCIGCSLCSKICPEGCIVMKNIANKAKPQINYDYCKGCGLCTKECPVQAIASKPENK